MQKPKLIPNARRVARKSWALRLAVLSAVLSGAEVAVGILAASAPSRVLAAAAGVVAVASAVARLIQQQGMTDGQ